jgi:hypothetical protein
MSACILCGAGGMQQNWAALTHPHNAAQIETALPSPPGYSRRLPRCCRRRRRTLRAAAVDYGIAATCCGRILAVPARCSSIPPPLVLPFVATRASTLVKIASLAMSRPPLPSPAPAPSCSLPPWPLPLPSSPPQAQPPLAQPSLLLPLSVWSPCCCQATSSASAQAVSSVVAIYAVASFGPGTRVPRYTCPTSLVLQDFCAHPPNRWPSY